MKVDLAALKAAAIQAESTTFVAEGFEQVVGNGHFYGGLIMHENGETIIAQCVMPVWAHYITAASPSIILELIRQIEESGNLVVPPDVTIADAPATCDDTYEALMWVHGYQACAQRLKDQLKGDPS